MRKMFPNDFRVPRHVQKSINNPSKSNENSIIPSLKKIHFFWIWEDGWWYMRYRRYQTHIYIKHFVHTVRSFKKNVFKLVPKQLPFAVTDWNSQINAIGALNKCPKIKNESDKRSSSKIRSKWCWFLLLWMNFCICSFWNECSQESLMNSMLNKNMENMDCDDHLNTSSCFTVTIDKFAASNEKRLWIIYYPNCADNKVDQAKFPYSFVVCCRPLSYSLCKWFRFRDSKDCQ